MKRDIFEGRRALLTMFLVALGSLTAVACFDKFDIFAPSSSTSGSNQSQGSSGASPNPSASASPAAIAGTCPSLTATVGGPGCRDGECPAQLAVGQHVVLNATPKLANGQPSECHGPAQWATSDGRVCSLSGQTTGLEGFNPTLDANAAGTCIVTIRVDGAPEASRAWVVR